MADNREEVFSTFQQPRLAPLGNTFLQMDELAPQSAEEKLAARREKMLSMAGMKAHSFSEYVPHQLQDIHDNPDKDLIEAASPNNKRIVNRQMKIDSFFKSQKTVDTVTTDADHFEMYRCESLGECSEDFDGEQAAMVTVGIADFTRQKSVPEEPEAEAAENAEVEPQDVQLRTTFDRQVSTQSAGGLSEALSFGRQRSYGMDTDSEFDFRWTSHLATQGLAEPEDKSDSEPSNDTSNVETRAPTWHESRVSTYENHIDTDDSDNESAMSPLHQRRSGGSHEAYSPTNAMRMAMNSPMNRGSPTHQVMGLPLQNFSHPNMQMSPMNLGAAHGMAIMPPAPPTMSPVMQPVGGPPPSATPAEAAFFRQLNNQSRGGNGMLPPAAPPCSPMAHAPQMQWGAWEAPSPMHMQQQPPVPGQMPPMSPTAAGGPVSLLDQVTKMPFGIDLSISEGIDDMSGPPMDSTGSGTWEEASPTHSPAGKSGKSAQAAVVSIAGAALANPTAAPKGAPTPKGGRSGSKDKGEGGHTTMMVRNLPHDMLQSELAADVDQCGFRGQYDFLYMPSTFGTGRGKGYAFVNFVTPEIAKKFAQMWHNTCRFSPASERAPLNVSAASLQGRDANVARWDTSKMRRIRNANHRPLVAVCMSKDGVVAGSLEPSSPTSPTCMAPDMCSPMATVAPLPPNMPTTPPQAASPSAGAQVDMKLVGQWCKIQGLTKYPQANGRWGMVETYDESAERYIVRVVMGDNNTWLHGKLKRENLDLPPSQGR